MLSKRSNQTAHHQSATKFESSLQDIENYQPVTGTAKILAAFLPIAQKKKTKTKTKQLLIFLTMLTQTD